MNVLVNQRSALDYLAVGLTKQFGTPNGFEYYPLAGSDKEFPSLLEQKMPGVGPGNPAVAEAIMRNQPYQPDNRWLRELNQLTREQKHSRLSAQLVRETFLCRVTERATGAVVQWRFITFEPGVIKVDDVGGYLHWELGENRPADAPPPMELAGPTGIEILGVPLDTRTQLPFPDPRLDVQRGPIQQWCFLKPHKPVLDALNGFHHGVSRAIREIALAAHL